LISLSRRSFLNKASIGAAALSPSAAPVDRGGGASNRSLPGEAEPTRYATSRSLAEWAYTSGKAYSDPFNDLELSVVFSDPQGGEHQVPAFWAGDQVWRIRYSPASPGRYTYRTICSDASNPDLHNRRGSMEVSPYIRSGFSPVVTQKTGWTEIARYVRSIDPYHHPVTIHPPRYG
jgi:hypothetical protein